MEPCIKLNLSEATFEDFGKIINKLRDEGALWSMNTEQLVKSFLSRALCQDLFPESFAIMRDAYIDTSFEENKDDIPNQIQDFCKYILEKYFGYVREPKEALMYYYDKAAMHLSEIDDRIKDTDDKIKKISEENIPAISQKELPVLYYYLKHNKRAREEVLTFVKDEIRDFSLKKCVQGLDFYNSYPYHYDYASRDYEVKHPNMISNKFGDLDLNLYRTIPEMYKNRKSEFYIFLNSYIENQAIVHSIRYSCIIDYVVNKRHEIVEEALSAYESGSNIAFSSMCLVVIEGVFHDLCLLLGENENDILGKGFQEKVNLLNDKYKMSFHYEYYSFMFRLLRNKVAHGIAEATELKEVAGLLLLDLHDVIKLSKSYRVPMNQKRYFLHAALTEPVPKNYEGVAGAVILKDAMIPAFYDTTDADAKILLAIAEDGFWEYLDGLLASEFDYDKGIAMEVLKRVKRLGIESVFEKCNARFKAHSNVKAKFDLVQYLRGTFQYAYY